MRITEPTTNPLTLVDRQGIAARLEVALSTVDKWKIRRLLPAPDFRALPTRFGFGRRSGNGPTRRDGCHEAIKSSNQRRTSAVCAAG